MFWLWDSYLLLRQYRIYKTTERVPDVLKDTIDHETFLKAKRYSIDKARFGFLSSIFGQIQSTVTICFFLMPYFWKLSNQIMTETMGFSRSETIEWEIFQTIMFTLVTSVVTTLIDLPLGIYNTFVIEQRHGFNKQTPRFYAWDKIKQFAISFLITSPVMAGAVYIVRKGGPYFFFYLWVLCFVVVLLLFFFHGEIAALFDKFTPLQPGDLRDRIELLATSIGFPLHNIFIVEGSKRSAHSNAYLGGMFSKKRIVIYDTLIAGYNLDKEEKAAKIDDTKAENTKGCDTDEILAVLCHEIGHWRCGHLMKRLTFAEVNYFFMFMIFSKFYQDKAFFAAFGFNDEMPVIIGLALLMMVLTPYNELLGFISTSLTRRFEYQADAFAKKLGHAQKLKTALIKLNLDNLGFPVYDHLYSKFNHSHPTLIQRLSALDKKSD